MKAKLIDIIFFIGILLLFVLLVFVVGCKDKAEATDSFVTKEVWISVELEEKPTFEDGNPVYLYESDEFDIIIVPKPEPREN